jgi:hypothetical protein
MTQVYTPVKGAPMTTEQAQRYGEELLVIEEEHKILTAQIVVEQASDSESPLNDWFTWKDAEAAKKWRNSQACDMLRYIEVEIEVVEGETTKTRAYHNVVIETVDDKGIETSQRGYVNTERVFTDKDLTAQTIEKALKALQWFQRKFSEYSALSETLKHTQAAIDELVKQE